MLDDTNSLIATTSIQRRREDVGVSDLTVFRFEELKTALKVSRSKQPAIIIGEDKADHMAHIGYYVASVMPCTPIVFDTPKAKKDFYTAVGDMRQYFQSVEVTRNQIQGSDCIMAFGDAIKPMFDTSYFVCQPSTDNPLSPRINFALISDMNDRNGRQFDRTWVDQCRNRRSGPSVF
jgi:hypothetical protein